MSKNAIGIILLLISLWGLEVPEKMVEDALTGIFAVVSLILMIWNQVNRSDVKLFLLKK